MTSFNELVQPGATSAWLFLPTAVVLGALHGLEPGHSKTMMAAFIVSIRGTVTQALMLGLAATVSHTAIIWILAWAGLHYAARLDVEKSEPYFQLASGVIILILAAWTFLRTRRERQAAAAHSQSNDHHHGEREAAGVGPHGGHLIDTGGHGSIEITVFEDGVHPRFRLFFSEPGHETAEAVPVGPIVSLETARPDGARQLFEFAPAPAGGYLESPTPIPEPHEFTAYVKVGHGNHAHVYKTGFSEGDHHHHDHDAIEGPAGSAEYQDAHERAHAADLERRFANREVTTGQIVVFGLTGGLLPCPAAFSVLLVCLQLKKFALGFATVLAFSLGLAITLVSAGAVAAISVRQAGKHFKGFGRMLGTLPYLSSGVMVAIGLFIAATGLHGILH